MKTNIVLVLLATVGAHSWLDCIGLDIPYRGPQQFYSDQFYKDYCVGYGRGYPGRSNRHINELFTVIVEGRGGPNPAQKNICGAPGQPNNYSPQFPMTSVAAGTRIKLWYEMDNHYNPQTNFHIYGFGVPGKQISTYEDQNQATALLTSPFATPANCIDINMPNTWCWAYWTIPADWQPGTYSFVWNWPWDQNPVGEEYNTCFDIQVSNPSANPIKGPKCRPRISN